MRHYRFSWWDSASIHYIVVTRDGGREIREHVFDHKNLMLYLLDTTVDAGSKDVYYYDEIFRTYRSDRIITTGEGHLLDVSKLFRQAYDYETEVLNRKSETRDGVKVFPDREWADCFCRLAVCDKEREYTPGSKFRGYRRYRIPCTMWRKLRFEERYENAVRDYDEDDYAPYLTHKTRHAGRDILGWYDDYSRARRSKGWKESSRRRHQYKGK